MFLELVADKTTALRLWDSKRYDQKFDKIKAMKLPANCSPDTFSKVINAFQTNLNPYIEHPLSGERFGRFVLERLPRPQESLCDLPLLRVQIPRQSDDFHSVTEWFRYPLKRVCGCDEEDVGEVVFELEVVIRERLVLGRIQDFQERGSRITVKVPSHLVDLVE